MTGKARIPPKALVLALLLLGQIAVADTVILDPIPVGTVSGQVGLAGETFGSGYVYSSAAGLGYSASFASDGTFSVIAGAGSTYALNIYYYQFQNAGGSQLRHYVYNQPALAENEVRSLDLRRAAGRVSGSVAVTGGTVESLSINATSSNSSVPEYFEGAASVGTPPYLAIVPMPVMPSTTSVYGTVTIMAANGCRSARSLPTRTVTVVAGAEASVQWSVDVSAESCSTGTLQGSLTTSGLSGQNADAVETSRQVQVSGPEYRYSQLAANQSNFLFENLRAGAYGVYQTICFQSPYSCYSPSGESAQVSAGQVTQYTRNLGLGTVHGAIALKGAWDLADVNYAYVSSGNAYDYLDPSNGRFDLIAAPGTSRLQYLQVGSSRYDTASGTSTYWYFYENLWNNSGQAFTLNVGDRLQLETHTWETSVADVVFEVGQTPGQPEAQINRLTVSGNGYLRDASTNAILASRSIYQDTSRNLPSRTANASLHGTPGTYQMQARGYGADGRQYAASFELTLGEPNDTPVGTNVETTFTDASGNPAGSLTFERVLQGGDTTVSQVSLGPNAPRNFKVFKAGGQPQYFDINTTAIFQGSVEVCIQYDDANLSDPSKEAQLELAHYDEATGTWQPITSAGYPDTASNTICGTTQSFSIFAILEVDVVDADLDGLADDVDNCPATANPGQEDGDADGIGNACDTDADGDSLPDATDLCPNFSNPNNGDLDGDTIGDPCDSDVDGDGANNGVDNCPAVPNGDQSDFDLDSAGDQCDVDDDGDSVSDVSDACPGSEFGAVTDVDGCTSPQRLEAACPVSGVYRNHGQYVSCVAREAEAQVAIGMINRDKKGVIVSTAAQTRVTTSK